MCGNLYESEIHYRAVRNRPTHTQASTHTHPLSAKGFLHIAHTQHTGTSICMYLRTYIYADPRTDALQAPTLPRVSVLSCLLSVLCLRCVSRCVSVCVMMRSSLHSSSWWNSLSLSVTVSSFFVHMWCNLVERARALPPLPIIRLLFDAKCSKQAAESAPKMPPARTADALIPLIISQQRTSRPAF